MHATERLEELDTRRARADERVDELEQQQRVVRAAVGEAAALLSELERRGDAKPAARAKAESDLAAARAAVDDPALAAKLDGARARVRDLRAERQRFVAEHLRELVEPYEREGEKAVAELHAACQQVIAAHARREAAAQAIGALAVEVGRVRPSDVGPVTRAEQVVAAASRLLMEGEPPARLLHDPREPRHGTVADSEPVSA